MTHKRTISPDLKCSSESSEGRKRLKSGDKSDLVVSRLSESDRIGCSSSIDSDSDSSDSDSSRERHSKEKRKHRHKKEKKKKKKKDRKKSESDMRKSSHSSHKKKKKKEKKMKKKLKKEDDEMPAVTKPCEKNKVKDSPSITPGTRNVMKPMTKEEWEKKQSAVRRVYDADTGRNRLVRGDGEVIEEIVSRERQREINKQATIGDGVSFQMKMGLLK